MWRRMNRFVLDTLPCLTWLLCDKLLTFARGSEDICGNMNRGTLMVQKKKNVLRVCIDMIHLGSINLSFLNTSIIFNHINV